MGNLAQNVRILRGRRNWTQRELFEATRKVDPSKFGVSMHTINKIERGEVLKPHAYTIAKIAAALGVTPSSLYADEHTLVVADMKASAMRPADEHVEPKKRPDGRRAS